MIQWAVDCMDELRKNVWREANKEKKEQLKRNVGRPKKGKEKPKSASSGKGYKCALSKNPENLTNKQNPDWIE